MELGSVLNEDILQNVVRPYLTLQTVARFAQTSKLYATIFEPGKIDTFISCFKKVSEDYHRCTHALGRFALYNNTAMFKRLWIHDRDIRNKNIEKLENKLELSLADQMSVYCKHYGNVLDVDKNITAQLQDAIMDREDLVIGRIVQNKKYNVFDLFNDETVEKVMSCLCAIDNYFVRFDNIFALLPVEDGEQKNKAVQYITKYDELSILIHLLKNGYLKPNEEYGNKCTLLHYAAIRGCRALTSDLLNQGGDIHVVNKWGKEPLYYAHLFDQEHRGFGHRYLYRGEGVAERLEGWCWDKHAQPDKITQQCMRGTQSYLEVSEEEKDWLCNSCTYSLEALSILK